MNKVTVVGSINVDSILHIKQLPQPGETIGMNSFSKAAGGKGANQAVSAARSGAKTYFVGCVGDDSNGDFMLKQLDDNKINIDNIRVARGSNTGQAYILLQESGQNSIIVQAGANFELTQADIEHASETIKDSDFVISEFETPMNTGITAFQLAHQAGKKTILNPAPANNEIPSDLLSLTDLIVPNETESELITGIKITDQKSMEDSARYYERFGIKNVIITIGEHGSYVSLNGTGKIVPAFKVNAVDTTAAGDTFIGALASVLDKDFSNLFESVVYASRASSLTVQKLGAFPSIPTNEAIVDAEK
ncbi:ribokinase [Companilactobacillus insicii]|uniref:ribokinase n=1 Tax=Companilactobacillus insicii TaxID=1732567 RepID=UPI000F792EBC|nr:ribokinase [Companilactobacillus insicii]